MDGHSVSIRNTTRKQSKVFCPHGAKIKTTRVKSLQSCLTLCDPIDCSPPGSPVYEILQVRILEWVARLSSRASSRARDGTCISCLLHWQMDSLVVVTAKNIKIARDGSGIRGGFVLKKCSSILFHLKLFFLSIISVIWLGWFFSLELCSGHITGAQL